MDEFDHQAFARLFNEVIRKCFGYPLTNPLTEPECRHLSLIIEEHTGLVVGWRSLKNYAVFLLQPSPDKPENPSLATLDTLARYVLDTPRTTEADRKRSDEVTHYWFHYREQGRAANPPQTAKSRLFNSPARLVVAVIGLVFTAALVSLLFRWGRPPERMETDFRTTDEATLRGQGWFVHYPNLPFWNHRATPGGGLTLFTLKGDNWPEAGQNARIQNLLLRPIDHECFQTEVHFRDFVPSGNWQQAGLLLLEDSLLRGKSIRLSLSYNNYFGGLAKPGEILLQAIASNGQQDRHLEEFIHLPLFSLANSSERRMAVTNLRNVAFRIEKQGSAFRFLYSTSPLDNFSFREVFRYESAMTPRYVGLFALKGFVDTTAVMPVRFSYFRMEEQICR